MMDISKIQAVIFDVDGTLYDQSVLRRKIALRLLSAYAIRPARGIQALRVIQAYRRAHEALRGCAFSAAIQLEAASLDSGYTVAEVRILVQEWMEQAPLALLAQCVYPGAKDLLETLVGLGIKCGVFSV
jgi:beta-phosphoglucomutase-like phosphatase (HAD superfamily)